jgi:peptidoglycan/LPS O-acetylase OafA/YrhL
MEQNSSSAMNTLKGVAISAVLINHYFNLNITGNYTGFANLAISIFFVLSGYGMSFSLRRRFGDIFTASGVFRFYFDRAIRIFPLLWLAWLFQSAVTGEELSPWILAGVHGHDHYWFIPSLLHCYLLAPLLFLGMRKRRWLSAAIFLPLLLMVNSLGRTGIFPEGLIKSLLWINGEYRDMFFLHIFLFHVGMMLPYLMKPKLESSETKSRKFNIHFWSLAMLTLAFMIFLKYSTGDSTLAKGAWQILPLIPLTGLVYFGVSHSVVSRPLAFLGSISYAVYLFHPTLYRGVSIIGGYPMNSSLELSIVVGLFPVFLWLAWLLEELGNRIALALRQLSLEQNS